MKVYFPSYSWNNNIDLAMWVYLLSMLFLSIFLLLFDMGSKWVALESVRERGSKRKGEKRRVRGEKFSGAARSTVSGSFRSYT